MKIRKNKLLFGMTCGLALFGASAIAIPILTSCSSSDSTKNELKLMTF